MVEGRKGANTTVPVTVQTSGLNAQDSWTVTSSAVDKVKFTIESDFTHVTIEGLDAIDAEGLATVTIKDTVSDVTCDIKVVYNV